MKIKPNKKAKSGAFLELETPVRLTEYKNGKQISSENIDSEVVLKLILHTLKEAIKNVEKT